MATRYKERYQDDKTLWQMALVPFVGVISEGPGAAYVRRRAPQMQDEGKALPVAVFSAMAEYVAQNPINPVRPTYSPCPLCGRASRIYKGRGGWPDMAHCERCNRTHIVKPDDLQTVAATDEPEPRQSEWWEI